MRNEYDAGTMRDRCQSAGFSMVEIVVAAAVFTVTVAAFIVSFDVLRSLSQHAEDRTAAALLLEEGGEAVLLLRDQGWSAAISPLANDTPYYLHWDGGEYRLSAAEIAVHDRYARRVTFSAAYRDGAGALAGSGALDPNTRRVSIEIMRLEDDSVLAAAEMLVHNAYE